MQKLSLAISPCPNDTFIFDAIVNKRIDTEGLEIELHFADVEALNEAAFSQQYDITKLSYHAYAYVSENYVLSNSGSALGNNCGPLLISKEILTDDQVNHSTIAIPGKYTTANFLFSLKYPRATQKQFTIFSDIEQNILSGKSDAGVIIHENRFTYQQKGLKKIVDLGEFWEQTYHAPIPLGGIAIKRNIEKETQLKIQRIIRQSIEFAFVNRAASAEFVKQHSQELADDVIQQHIHLYVNDFSTDLGEKGKRAVETLYTIATEKKLIPPLQQPIFL